VPLRKQAVPSEPFPPTKQTKALIELRQVYKVYETAAGDFPALRGINAAVYPAEFLGVIGKSGAGKSTLLNNPDTRLDWGMTMEITFPVNK